MMEPRAAAKVGLIRTWTGLKRSVASFSIRSSSPRCSIKFLAEEDTPHSIPNAYNLPEAVHNAFRAKVLLYREALILFALVGKSHADPLFVPALREYEHILFQAGPEEAVRSGRFQAVRDAMKDITDLLTPRDDPYLSWARRWFAGIGHDETNPITLGVFLCFWMDWYVAVQTSLNKMVA